MLWTHYVLGWRTKRGRSDFIRNGWAFACVVNFGRRFGVGLVSERRARSLGYYGLLRRSGGGFPLWALSALAAIFREKRIF